MSERLTLARLALANALEIYAPMNASRGAAIEAVRNSTDELEAAAREDERSLVSASKLFKESEAAIRADERAKVLTEVNRGDYDLPAFEDKVRADERAKVLAEVDAASGVGGPAIGKPDHLPEPLGRDADAPVPLAPPPQVPPLAPPPQAPSEKPDAPAASKAGKRK